MIKICCYTVWLLLVQHVCRTDSSLETATESAKCVATDVGSLRHTMMDTTLINSTAKEEPVYFQNNMLISVCRDGSTIQMNWFMNVSQENIVLCYILHATFNWKTLEEHCYKLLLTTTAREVSVTCWFDSLSNIARDRPDIRAWTYGTKTRVYTGTLNTAVITDLNQSCLQDYDVCKHHTIDLHSLALCRQKVQLRHDDVVNIRQLSFEATQDTECATVDLTVSPTESPGTKEFELKCGFNSTGTLKVLYEVHGVLCNQKISRESCQTAYIPRTLPISSKPEVLSTKVLALIIVAAVSTLVLILVIPLFFALRVFRRREVENNLRGQESGEGLRLTTDEGLKLTTSDNSKLKTDNR